MLGFFHHRDPAGTDACNGCRGDDFMAEGSDALLERLNRVMKDEFDANMLGRVGRGQLAEVKFLKLRWHEQEMCFRWSGGTRYVTEVAVLLGLTNTRAVTKTLGTKATGGGARDALERLDTFQAVTFRSAVGLIGDIVLDRPDCQYAAKTVRSATGEPAKLDWMRMMRLAKFLVPHSELEWLCQVQDVPGVRRRGLGGLGKAQPEHSNSLDTSHRIQLLDPARHRSLSLSLKRRGRAVCNRTCGSRRVAVSSAVGRGWNESLR